MFKLLFWKGTKEKPVGEICIHKTCEAIVNPDINAILGALGSKY